MTAYIPYVDRFSVGDTLDWTKENLGQGDAKLTRVDKPRTNIDKPEVETRGCIVKTIEDVVQLLEIPPELALKVKSGQVENPPIAEIVTHLYDENVLTVVFQVRICLCKEYSEESTPGTVFDTEKTTPKTVFDTEETTPKTVFDTEETTPKTVFDTEETTLKTVFDTQETTPKTVFDTEETTPKTVSDTSDSSSSNIQNAGPSHLSKVTAKVWGDELIVVMKLSKKGMRQSIDLSYYNDVLSVYIDSGIFLEDGQLNKLTKMWATKLDNRISNAEDDSVPQMTVKCFSFDPFSHDPSTATGFMSIINNFRIKCQQLASSFQLPPEARFDNSPIHEFKHEQSRSSMGKLVVSPLSLRTDLIYQLSLCVQDNSGGVPRAAQFEFTEKVFKAMRALENTRTKTYQLIDPKVAVIRDTDDYKIQQRLADLDRDMNEITQFVEGMGLGVASHHFIESLCDNAIKDGDLKIPGGNPLIMALFGKTGHGKSSTGNSVLQDSLFAISSDQASQTKTEEKGETTTDDRELCIVDTPGLYDTHIMSIETMKKEAIDFIKKVIILSPEGYDAFLLVMKYGSKITNEEMDTITLFKRVFGKDVIKSRTVFVITAGDEFLSLRENHFNKWCRNTTSRKLDKLFKECQYRCVLFDNKTKDKNMIKNQLIRLVSLVDTIGSRYTDEVFQQAKASRDQLRQEILSPERREKLLVFFNYVLECAKEGEELDPETLKEFSKIQKEAEKLSDNDKSVIFPIVENINIFMEKQNEMQQKERERKAREQEEKNQQEKMEKVLKALHQTGTLINAGTIMFQESLTILETYKAQAKMLPQNLQSIVVREISLIEDTSRKHEKTRLEEKEQREKADKYQKKVTTLNAKLRSISLFVIDNDELDPSKLDILDHIKTEAEDLKEHDCNNILGQVEAIKKNNEKNKQNKKKEKELEEAYEYQDKIKNMKRRLESISSLVVMGTEINIDDLKFLKEAETEVRCLKKNDENNITRQIATIKEINEKNKRNKEHAENLCEKAENYQQKVKNLQHDLIEISRSVNAGEEIDSEQRKKLDELKPEIQDLEQDDMLHIQEQIKIIEKIGEQNTKDKAEKRQRDQMLSKLLGQLKDMENKIANKQKFEKESLDNFKQEEYKISHFPEEEKITIFSIKRNILKLLGKDAAAAMDGHNNSMNKIFEEAVEDYIKNGCFSADDVVETKDGSKVKMENLKVGDLVLARDGQGKLFYDPVYMFGHREEDAFSNFIIFETTKQKVSVTENHLVFCVQNELEICVAAGCVQPGDKLIVAVSDQNAEQIPVIKVSRERKRGLFAPFTKSGTVVVNGALMSCYVNIFKHQTAHNALWPVRQLYDISPATVAFVNGAKKNTAVPVWAETTYNVISYVKNTRNKLSKYFS